MGYFPVRYDSRVINYDRRGFIRLATVQTGRNLLEIGTQWAVLCKQKEKIPIICNTQSSVAVFYERVFT